MTISVSSGRRRPPGPQTPTPAPIWLARSHKIVIEQFREHMGYRSILTTQQHISAADNLAHILTSK